MDPRAEKFKLAMMEFAAHSDMRHRMALGFARYHVIQYLYIYMYYIYDEHASITLRNDAHGCTIGFTIFLANYLLVAKSDVDAPVGVGSSHR